MSQKHSGDCPKEATEKGYLVGDGTIQKMQPLSEKIRELERDREEKNYPSIFQTPVHQFSVSAP